MKKLSVIGCIIALVLTVFFFLPHRHCDNCEKFTAYGVLVPTHCCIGTSAYNDLRQCLLALQFHREMKGKTPITPDEVTGILRKEFGESFDGMSRHIRIESTTGGWFIHDNLPADYRTHFVLGPDLQIHRAKGRPARLDDPVK